EAAGPRRRAGGGPGRTAMGAGNLALMLAALPDPEGARAALEDLRREYPEAAYAHLVIETGTTQAAGDYARAHAAGERLTVMPDVPPAIRLLAQAVAVRADAGRGRLAEARRHLASMAGRARELSYVDVVQFRHEEAFIERLFGTPDAFRAALQA